ncbi:GntR family transcriptional regulator [Belnapia sp. T18]|uniref:GntR family transcriptional regulator n=1 Tax=Belnapia arida TaxID=2804533 RepID=A0ABS1UAT0_9PROT|nr:GntR family transcriptional regulator [Belnapia arida]MBL6081792.1 GntR family transcriptional regulator [Belnapia arida]
MNDTETGPNDVLPLGKSAKSLPERLADLILAEVMAGRLRAGDRLKEETLAQQHAVSRATVREALIALAKGGYVVRVPRFGARVAEFSSEDVADLFELRATLLGVAAGRCARVSAPATLAGLQDLAARMEQLAADPATDPQAFAACSVRAQALLVGGSGNRYLPDVYERLAGISSWQLIRCRAASFLRAGWRAESAADWRRLVDRVVAGDAGGAEAAARLLLNHSAARVQQQLEEPVAGQA